MNTIYVIVRVTYDYYRFQYNLAATTNEEQAVALAEEYARKHRQWKATEPLPVLRGDASAACDEDETPHICIQEFPY